MKSKALTDLNEVQARMAPGVTTLGGFFGTDSRSIGEIIADDAAELAKIGVSYAAIVRRMKEISRAGLDMMEEPVLVEQRFHVKVRQDRGLLACPYGDGLFCKGETEVTDQESGRILRWNPLTMHLMEVHGFCSGRGGEYRLDPVELVKILNVRRE